MYLSRKVIVTTLFAAVIFQACARPSWASPLPSYIRERGAEFFTGELAEPFAKFASGGAIEKARDLVRHLPDPGRRTPNAERRFILLALAHIEGGDNAAARQALERARRIRPSSSDAAHLLGLVHRSLEQHESAAKLFEEAAFFGKWQLVPSEENDLALAELLLDSDNPERGVKALERAIAHNPAFGRARAALARHHLKNGKRPEALLVLRNGLTAAPDDPELTMTLARTLLTDPAQVPAKTEVAKMRDALEPLTADDNPNKRAALPLYVTALLRSGELEAAEKRINEGLKTDPNNGELVRLREQLAIHRRALEYGAAEATPAPRSKSPAATDGV